MLQGNGSKNTHRMEFGLRRAVFAFAFLALAIPLWNVSTRVYFVSFVAVLAFAALVLLMAACALVLAFGSPQYRLSLKNPVVQGVVVLMLGNVLLLPFATDVGLAFWSQPMRMTGVFFLLLTGAFTLSLIAIHPNAKEWRRLFIWNTVVATLLAISGVVIAFLEPGERVFSTFSNPISFGMYVLVSVFIAGVLLVTTRVVFERRLLWFALTMLFAGLVVSMSRGPMLGLVLGLFTATTVWFLSQPGRGKRTWTAMTGVIIFVIALVAAEVFFNATEFGIALREQLPMFLERLFTTRATNRFYVWDIAFTAWRDAPVFGWGYETFGTLFAQYVDFTGAHVALTETGFDRPHNEFVYVLVSTGIIGFCVTLFYWISLFRSAAHVPKTERAVVFGLLVGYLAAAQWIFVIVQASVLMALVAAYLGSAYKSTTPVPWKFKPVPALVVLCMLMPTFWWCVIRPVEVARMVEHAVDVGLTDPVDVRLKGAREQLEPAFKKRSFVARRFRLRVYELLGKTTDLPHGEDFERFLYEEIGRMPFERMTFAEQLAFADLSMRVHESSEVLSTLADTLRARYPRSVDPELIRLLLAIDARVD